MQKSEEEWRKELTPEQYKVLRQKATEAPNSGALLHEKRDGMYRCAACGAQLFEAGTKFESRSGWPSFYDAIPGSVVFTEDNSHSMQRTEITCANCGSHLGHIFNDAYDQPTGMRYCVNSVALQFEPKS